MEHNLKINVSKKPTPDSIVFCKTIKVRERILRFLLGDCRKVTILVPGDSFGAPGYFRIAYCIDTEKVERSLEAFRRFVKAEY